MDATLTIGDSPIYSDLGVTITTGAPFIYVTSTILESLKSQLPADTFDCDDYGCTATQLCSDIATDMPSLTLEMKNTDGSSVAIDLTGDSYTWGWNNGVED